MIGRLHSRTPKTTPDGKRLQMIVCSATLHSVDFRKVHLERHGKLGGGGYAYRQLDVWARQFRAVDGFVRRETPDDAELHAASDAMLELEAWLRGALRSFVSEEEPTCIVHGDFRLAAG